MREGWQWEADGFICQGCWGDRKTAAHAAEVTLPSWQSFRIFHGPVPLRRKKRQLREVGPWIDTATFSDPAGETRFPGWSVEYREVDA